MSEKIELKETRNGFSERDLHSKAILNTDQDSLLKYKIQRSRMQNMNTMSNEIEKLKMQVMEMQEIIKKFTVGNKCQ
jgi:hypothetical protein